MDQTGQPFMPALVRCMTHGATTRSCRRAEVMLMDIAPDLQMCRSHADAPNSCQVIYDGGNRASASTTRSPTYQHRHVGLRASGVRQQDAGVCHATLVNHHPMAIPAAGYRQWHNRKYYSSSDIPTSIVSLRSKNLHHHLNKTKKAAPTMATRQASYHSSFFFSILYLILIVRTIYCCVMC